jgi:hypothetical protein
LVTEMCDGRGGQGSTAADLGASAAAAIAQSAIGPLLIIRLQGP